MNEPQPTRPGPAAQDRLIGHQGPERTLARAASSGRMAHSWLFCGPEGVGKATLAYRFARHLLSGAQGEPGAGLDGPSQDPNGRVFRLIAGEAHPDLLAVQRPDAPESGGRAAKKPQDLPVEEVRKIPAFLSLAASDGGWRVVIIDEADRLNRNSANALLKVLEEPPDRTVLIMVTATPGRLVPTIRSRCRRLTLDSLSDEDMTTWVEQSGLQIEPADREPLIGLAKGAPGRLVQLVETDSLATVRSLDAILSRTDSIDWQAVHTLAGALAQPAADAAYEFGAQYLCDRIETAIKSHATGNGHSPIPAWSGQGGPARLDRLLEVWDKARDLLASAKGANLDKRAVLIQIFASLESAARAA